MLLFDENKYSGLSERDRQIYLLQWMQRLPNELQTVPKSEIKSQQKSLVQQFTKLLTESLPPAHRTCLSVAVVSLFNAGDTNGLFDIINRCSDVVRMKDDSTNTPNKLTCIECIGRVYRAHGRMAGTLFQDVVQVLIKALKNPELRPEIYTTLEDVVRGLGQSAATAFRDIVKCIKSGLVDKLLCVRSASAKCCIELVDHNMVLYTQELDSLFQCCLKSYEGSSYDVRCWVAKLLGTLLSKTQKPLDKGQRGKVKLPSLQDVLLLLSNGFIKGGGGFLKGGGHELLKGGLANWDVRVGVTQAYIAFISEMGGVWLEKHLSLIIRHLLYLLSSPKTITTHVDAVYSRKCINFILRVSFSRLLGETSQIAAAKCLCQIISFKGSDDVDKTSMAHMIVCGVTEIAAIIHGLNTAAAPLVIGDNISDGPGPVLEALNTILLLQNTAARLSGSWCFYCIGLALPSQLTILIDYVVNKIRVSRGSADTLLGYTYCLSSLLSTAQHNQLGVPSNKAFEVFQLGQELVQTKLDGGNLAMASIEGGWALIGAYLTLGPVYVRAHMKTVLTLWHQVFPHSQSQLSTEIETGTAVSWKHLLETRSSVLSSVVGFLSVSHTRMASDLAKRILLPLSSGLAMTAELPVLVKTHGIQLKAGGAMLRLRLYHGLNMIDPHLYEGSLNTLLRELVAEFTLTDAVSVTTTSLLRLMCHHGDSILLGSWLEETDHSIIEEMLQPNSAAGSGALEHDPTSTYINTTKDAKVPGPLPLGVAVIDAAITLFGRVFHLVSSKHRQQLLDHFKDCIKQAKASRQMAIQINIFTAFLAALKGLAESKVTLGDNDIISAAYGLISGALASSNSVLRCAAGEALGRLSQVVGEVGFVSQVVQMSVDTLKTSKETGTRTGHCLALGCLHRYVGGMSSGQHLNISVATLQEIATDTTSPTIQVWALHALALIADSGGPLFRNHVDSTLTLVLSLLIQTPPIHTEVHRCLGNCLSALLTTLGPELQIESKTMSATREMCLLCCSLIRMHQDSIVQSSGISCLQQLQLFAPALVDLKDIVPTLYRCLDESHLLLRRSAANSLRQFSQQNPQEVWSMLSSDSEGLEHTVLAKLDIETDSKLRYDLMETLFSLLTSLAPTDPMKWLVLCNNVLSTQQTTGETQETHTTVGAQDEDEDMAKFTTSTTATKLTNIVPRWSTKEFAVQCSRKIYSVCRNDPKHFNLELAQQSGKASNYLVLHLSELVRTSFISATASVDQLKLAGYEALQDVIELFASTADPEYPGHVLLEQYQAQIGAALRPAFTADTAPHVTAMACQVCSKWLGSGVSRDINDLKRVQQLLVTSLDKLQEDKRDKAVRGETLATMESLSVLKAWAELYIKVSTGDGSASELVGPHLQLLSDYWLAALKDFAYLSLPSHFNSQLPMAGGTFYNHQTAPIVRPYYNNNWSSMLHAASIWINRGGLKDTALNTTAVPAFADTVSFAPSLSAIDETQHTLHLLVGLCAQVLCTPSVYDDLHDIECSLSALHQLVATATVQSLLMNETFLVVELLSLLHRVLLTSTQHDLTVLSIASTVCDMLHSNSHRDNVTDTNKSCSYKLLVLASYSLFRILPHLHKTAAHKSASTDSDLISVSLCLLTDTVSVCTSDSLTHSLSSILYMMLSAILYASTHNLPCINSLLQSFSKLISLIPPDITLLQSTLNSVLIPQDSPLSFASIPSETKLVIVSILLMYSQPVCSGSSTLLKHSTSFIKECLSLQQYQLKTLHVLETLYRKSPLSAHFIQETGPDVIKLLQKSKESSVVVKAAALLEAMLELAPDEKKVDMMGVVISLYVSLLDGATHNHILHQLMLIGPKYPSPFRAIMASSPHLKIKLENAIKTSKTVKAQAKQPKAAHHQQQPAIQLKMDFSNFK